MSELTKEILNDCVEVICSIHNRKPTEVMVDFYFNALEEFTEEQITLAFQTIINDRYFPTPDRIKEVITGKSIDKDWNEIIAVASGTKTSAEISGIADMALKSIGGLKKVACANNDETVFGSSETTKLKNQFLKLVSIPSDPNSLPPANVTIKIGTQEYGKDREYPVDWDFSIRTASLIRLVTNKEISPETAETICNGSNFPSVKKAEIMNLIQSLTENNQIITTTKTQRPAAKMAAAIKLSATAIKDLAGMF